MFLVVRIKKFFLLFNVLMFQCLQAFVEIKGLRKRRKGLKNTNPKLPSVMPDYLLVSNLFVERGEKDSY